MSKSIYEEAKKLITKAYNEQISMSEHDVIFDALEQAQKQNKSLNKIKEIVDRPYDSDSYYIASVHENLNRFFEIGELIRELDVINNEND